MEKALVTGASGFIGKRLCNILLARGFEVYGFVRKADNLDSRVRWHFGDIADFNVIKMAVLGIKPSCVFHLAADIRRQRDHSLFSELFRVNVLGTLNVLEICRMNGVSAFIFPGTFEEYGDNEVPFKETMAPRPLSPYGITKALASLMVQGYGRSDFRTAVLRMPIVYGPGQSSNFFISSVCGAVLRGERIPLMMPGNQTRDFLFIDDAIEAFIKIAKNIGSLKGEILNVCNGIPFTIIEAAKIICGIAEKKFEIEPLPRRQNEQMNYFGDSGKIKKLIGWQANVSFEDGIKRVLFP